jgi:26S proteasome regulatory subunit N13
MPAQTLLSFRAGKMNREADTSNNVLPDERKGYIQLLNEDELLHFQWKERNATDPEDDLIIFPDDARFLRVAEALDGRVYMLRFESSKAKHFFWMQVPDSLPSSLLINVDSGCRINQRHEIRGS